MNDIEEVFEIWMIWHGADRPIFYVRHEDDYPLPTVSNPKRQGLRVMARLSRAVAFEASVEMNSLQAILQAVADGSYWK